MNVTISNYKLSVEISTLGAEIMRVTGCDGTEYIWDGNPDVWSSRALILFPICGGLKDNKYSLDGRFYSLAKHGFVRNSEFKIEEHSDTSVTFCLSDNEETRKAYPFSFDFRVEFSLEGETLTAVYSVFNKSDNKMYFSVGAHEGYACPEGIEEYKIIFEKSEELRAYILDGSLLSDKYVVVSKGKREFPLLYDYFAVDALIFKDIESKKVTLAGGGKEITVEFDGFDNLLLWTKPDAGYICIEPWTGVPDVVGSGFELSEKEGITELSSGDTYNITHKMTFKNRIG